MSGVPELVAELPPVNALLALGVVAAVGSRSLGLSPILGYLILGLGLGGLDIRFISHGLKASMLSDLGLVFLLFDIGLHFSLRHLRSHARDIFGFGPMQVLAGTLGLGSVAMLLGLPGGTAMLVGGTLSLSSTAVVAGLIAERHQQTCPVGQTATAILVFQDIAAIFLLIVADALGGTQALLPIVAAALLKAAVAFGLTVIMARIVVRPLFELVARSCNEEVFTAMALLVALAAGWATGAAGLSLTLGAFLGGMIIAGTPYRVVIQSEIQPFRALLLGFFFISVGLSLDVSMLLSAWASVVAVTILIIAIKVLTNAAASLVFGWSVPGSTQLGFLLAQGSEFAFVVLSLAPVRALVGEHRSAVLISAVALSLALTPLVAGAGRALAGRMHRHTPRIADPELEPSIGDRPVLIAGMGQVGRDLADALTAFDIRYSAVEQDEKRLREAVADGYDVSLGNVSNPHVWQALAVSGHRILVLTAPSFEVSQDLAAIAQRRLPGLRRIVVVRDEAEADQFRSIGSTPVIARTGFPGLDVASAVLTGLDVDAERIAGWMLAQQERVAPNHQVMAA